MKPLFKDAPKDKVAELVMIVEGVSEETAGPLLDAWSSIKPAFTISNPPSVRTTQKLADDLELQVGEAKKCSLDDAINPFADECWNGKSKIMHLDLNRQSKVLTVSYFDRNRLANVGTEQGFHQYFLRTID